MSALRPELCVGAIAQQDGCLLLIRRAQPPQTGYWSLPGGRVEPGETLAEATVREVEEETGLTVMCDALVGWVERIVPDQHHFVIMDFDVTVIDDSDPVPGSDALEARWIPLGDVPDMGLVDGLLDFLADNGIIDAL